MCVIGISSHGHHNQSGFVVFTSGEPFTVLSFVVLAALLASLIEVVVRMMDVKLATLFAVF